jgi:hypothetical protein
LGMGVGQGGPQRYVKLLYVPLVEGGEALPKSPFYRTIEKSTAPYKVDNTRLPYIKYVHLNLKVFFENKYGKVLGTFTNCTNKQAGGRDPHSLDMLNRNPGVQL